MTRNEFIKICGILGVTWPYHTSLAATHNAIDNTKPGSSDKVLIIGAGAAGLSAGHLLKQKNIAFQILEAASGFGGRMKKTDDFADFPIPLGAEWLTVNTSVFNEIVNNHEASVNVNTTGYNQNVDYGIWENGKLLMSDLGDFNYIKFINGTWFDFYEKYIVPAISQNITYNSTVKAIDYSGRKVIVSTENEKYKADKVIVTVPLKIIQNGAVKFIPPMPKKKLKAIDSAVIWDGIKVFLEFSEKFYPAFVDVVVTPETSGQIAYFDAAYGQNTDKHVLGLFAVGEPANKYASLSDEDLKNYILAELDLIFQNKATPNYVKHIVQNWSDEPHIEGAYLNDHEDWRTVQMLGEPIGDKIYFAGEAYTSGLDWGDLHAAARAAKVAVDKITS